MKRFIVPIGLLVAMMCVSALAANRLPIRMEVFQEVSIDQAENVPAGVTNLRSIEVEPVAEAEVLYKMHFDSVAVANDTVPLTDRYAYQDLQKIQVFDFYNCFSSGNIDGIAIRKDPVNAVDTKMFRSRDGNTYVMRVVFYCGDNVTATVTEEKSTISVLFKGDKKVGPAAAVSSAGKSKSSKEPFIKMKKNVLYGIGLAALVGASATFLLGQDIGENAGREDAYEHPRSILPGVDQIPVPSD